MRPKPLIFRSETRSPNLKRYLLPVCGLGLLAVFAGLGEIAKSGPLSIDRHFALWFKAHRTAKEVQWAQVLSAMTTPIIVLSAIVMLLLYLNYVARSWHIRDFIPLAFVLTCAVIASVAKPYFDRVRPGAGLSTLFDFEPSYPSSHTVYMAAAISSLFFVVGDRRAWVFVPAALITGLIGLSRLVLGVHWITDLIGGAALAMGVWVIFYLLDDWLVERERNRI